MSLAKETRIWQQDFQREREREPGRVWAVPGRALSALQNRLLSGTRHQMDKHLNHCERQQKRLSSLSSVDAMQWGQKNLMKSMLSQLSHLSQSKNTDPEARDPLEALQNLPDGCYWVGWGTPPFGSFWDFFK